MINKFLSILAFSLLFIQPLHAKYVNNDPYMIVRINKAHVDYSKSLKTALDKAKDIKENVNFKITSFEPATSDKNLQGLYNKNLEAFHNQIQNLDVDNLQVDRQLSPSILFQEIHLFVE